MNTETLETDLEALDTDLVRIEQMLMAILDITLKDDDPRIAVSVLVSAIATEIVLDAKSPKQIDARIEIVTSMLRRGVRAIEEKRTSTSAKRRAQ